MRTINRAVVTAVSLALLSGCAAQSVSQVGEAPREAISYAATAKYPGNPTASPNIRATAVDNADDHNVMIYNVSDTGIPGSTVWVNGAFVHQIGPIAPRAVAKVDYSQLLEAGQGVKTLKQLGQPVTKVELQTSDGLHPVEGPAHP